MMNPFILIALTDNAAIFVISLCVRLLVTGAAGFLGSHFSERAIKSGYEVVGLDSLNDYYAKAIKNDNLEKISRFNAGNFRWIHKDLLDIQEYDIEGIDAIVHFAGRAGVRFSWGQEFDKYLTDNVRASQHLFEINKGIRPIVYASSSSVYGNSNGISLKESSSCNPLSPYGVTKLAVDNLSAVYHERDGGTYVGARFFSIYGPRQRPDMAFTSICRSLLKSESFKVFGEGRQRRHFTYIDDAIEATMRLLLVRESGVYNISSSESASLMECIEIFNEVAGTELQTEFIPRISDDAQEIPGDASKISERCGWKSEVPLRLGISNQWEWACSHRELLVQD